MAIVGGGASGTLAAVHLLRASAARQGRARIVLIDRHGRHRIGAANATTEPAQPTGPGQTFMMRIPGPEGLRQAPGHAPAQQEARAGTQHATLPGQFVAGSGAQVENQILPDGLHLMHAATVMA